MPCVRKRSAITPACCSVATLSPVVAVMLATVPLTLLRFRARFLSGHGPERLDGRERRFHRPTVDPALLVQVSDHRFVDLLPVAEVDVDDVTEGREVDVGDAEVDLVLRHARRLAPGAEGRAR